MHTFFSMYGGKQEGFSLLEALVGVLLLTLVGTTALKCFQNAQDQVARVRYAERAQRVMSGLLQQIIATRKMPPLPTGTATVPDGEVAWRVQELRIPSALWHGDIRTISVEYTLDNGDTFTLRDYYAGATDNKGAL